MSKNHSIYLGKGIEFLVVTTKDLHKGLWQSIYMYNVMCGTFIAYTAHTSHTQTFTCHRIWKIADVTLTPSDSLFLSLLHLIVH